MKPIEQLLILSQNRFYKMTEEEKERLNNFLLKKQGGELKSSETESKKSQKNTPVTVRNIVQKTAITVPESNE